MMNFLYFCGLVFAVMSEYFTISNANELFHIMSDSIVCVTSDGNYSDLHTRDGEQHTVTLQLGVIEQMMKAQLGPDKENEFVRIGKCLIVNMRFVSYINPSKRQIVLSDSHTFKHNVEASREALRELKDYFEKKMKQK